MARSSGMTSRVAYPVAEEVCGDRRVAQLADVSTGIGEAEGGPLVGE